VPARDVGLVVLAAVAFVLSAWSAWMARRDVAGVREQVREAREQLVSLESRMGEGGRSPGEAALLARAAAAVDAPPERVVSALAVVLPDDVRVDRLAIEYASDVGVEMQVVARDAGAWDRFLARMEESPSFESVMPGPERRTGEVKSVVRARFTGGGR